MPFANDLARLRTNEAIRFLASHRVFLYSVISILSVWAVIANALKSYSNFYSVAIYLSKSSRSVLVLANFGVLLALLSGHIVQRIFFGALRANEIERLYDRLWFFITESLLAFTIFRDDFDGPFALMFGFLLFVKAFHWLASDRIEWMDQQPYPGPPLLFHFRMNVLFTILWLTDALMFVFAIEHTLTKGVGGMVLFASEYGILVASVMNTMFKYMLSTYDLRRAGRRGGENAPAWENKSMWIFYIELATDFMKLTTYLVFFIVIITFYGLPLNIVRDVYVTARSFITRLRALHRYQTATRNMDQRYPNATEDELTAMNDRTCIICREEMVPAGPRDPDAQQEGPNTTPKKLPCGHIFHFHCLRSWLERQQSCPTCRRNVLDEGNQTPETTGQQGQRPNVQRDQQQQNGPAVQQAPNGNQGLGFLGRLFGQPQPANPPLNRQPGQNFNNNPNNNQPQRDGQQAGIFINYQVQYQFPRRQNEVNPTAAEPLQPVPPYNGFPGPNGVWQPWPVEQAGEGQVHGQPPPTPTINESTPAPTPSQNPPDKDTEVRQPREDRELSPREAARQAALKRFGGFQTTDVPAATPATGSQQVPDVIPSTAPSDVSQPRPPNLIPLFNFNSARPSFPPPTSGLQASTPQTSAHPSRYHFSERENRSTTSNLATPTSTTSAFHSSVDPNPAQSSRLPENLTEEQLAILDKLTREAIDERLRVMERASVTVYQCINELLSLRSALPPVGAPNPASSATKPNTDTSLDLDKGKAKEKGNNVSVPNAEDMANPQAESSQGH
ncbi:hypothetical protein CPB83DRAFT_853010 [Crepidotus variabilis]|uniref:RING-type E3 ubiquitin transferase n=1 Tax=Crepidotus variabilis TaxID=179855 RepID=A0A9P6EGR2_9AGAR|nr:hypothetical protein CPB83DRAFT_853010 [Crepidotus variabilis]